MIDIYNVRICISEDSILSLDKPLEEKKFGHALAIRLTLYFHW